MTFRSDFPVFTRHPELIYLDSTATMQKPRAVIDAMCDFMEGKYANIHRGSYELSEQSEKVYEASKKAVCHVIHAKDTAEIFYTYNATYGMNLIAESLRVSWKLTKGDTILTTAIEHHANLVPWFIAARESWATVRVLPLAPSSVFDYDGFSRSLTHEVRVITVTAASNVTGEIIDLARIHTMITETYTPEERPYFIVDASQLIPHASIDVESLEIDFLVFTAHKMMADTGLGIVYGKKELLRELTPSFWGGWAINVVTHTGFIPAGLPSRWEPWTPHIIGAASLLAALDYIDSIGWYATIEAVERDLIEYTWKKIEKLSEFEGIFRLIGGGKEVPRIGVWSFFTPTIHVSDLADMLAERHIAVRAWHHCAEPLHHENDIPASIRMSYALYTTQSDIDAFFAVLEEILRKAWYAYW